MNATEALIHQLKLRRDHYLDRIRSLENQVSRLEASQAPKPDPQPVEPAKPSCPVCQGSGSIETQIVRPDPYTGQLTRYGSTTAECPMRCNPQAVASIIDKSRQIMLEETQRAIKANNQPRQPPINPLDLYRP